MNLETIRKFATDQANRLSTGDLNHFAQHFDLPLPVYAQDSLSVVTDRAQLRPALEHYFDAMQSLGIRAMKPWAVCIEDQSEHRAIVTIRWEHLNHAGDCKCVSKARYVVRDPNPDTETEPSVEMVEYLSFAFPSVYEELHKATRH
jgi:hypothetical protein